MTASEVSDFPEPDSPTSPSTSPGAIEKERSRTAKKRAAVPLGFTTEEARAEASVRDVVAFVCIAGDVGLTAASPARRNSTFKWRTSSNDTMAMVAVAAIRPFRRAETSQGRGEE